MCGKSFSQLSHLISSAYTILMPTSNQMAGRITGDWVEGLGQTLGLLRSLVFVALTLECLAYEESQLQSTCIDNLHLPFTFLDQSIWRFINAIDLAREAAFRCIDFSLMPVWFLSHRFLLLFPLFTLSLICSFSSNDLESWFSNFFLCF